MLLQGYQVVTDKQRMQYLLTLKYNWRTLKVCKKSQSQSAADLWIRLPRHKRPNSWSNIEDPVVPRERNLYGHSLAGLLWERTVRRQSIGNWMGQSTELGMSVHRKQGLFLSVYVDDIKMVGNKQNMAPMWKKSLKNVDLDEPTSFLDHVFVGMHTMWMQDHH